MFFQRSTHTVCIPVELQQALRQCTIIQAGSFQQIGNDGLVLTFFKQSIDGLACIVHTSSIQVVEEGETMDVVKEFFLKVCSRNIIIRTQKFEHILEHTAGRTRSRHKLHNF